MVGQICLLGIMAFCTAHVIFLGLSNFVKGILSLGERRIRRKIFVRKLQRKIPLREAGLCIDGMIV